MGNRYAVSDLHGQFDLFTQIKEYINEDDIVYALGDFGDRGPEPWRTLQAVLDDSQFIYLMGNHDLMLVKAIEALLRIPQEEWEWSMSMYSPNSPLYDLFINGGKDTLFEWTQDPNRMKYYYQLCNLPIEITLPAADKKHLIHLSHAGYNPDLITSEEVEDFVWDRFHFYHEYKYDNLIVHGHTPYIHMNHFLNKDEYTIKDGYCIYNDGKKINIDCGTIVNKETVLLNLDTLEAKVFKVKEVANETKNK